MWIAAIGLPSAPNTGAATELASIANSRRESLTEAGAALPNALTEGFQTALMVGAGFAIVGAVLALVLVGSGDPQERVDGELVPVSA